LLKKENSAEESEKELKELENYLQVLNDKISLTNERINELEKELNKLNQELEGKQNELENSVNKDNNKPGTSFQLTRTQELAYPDKNKTDLIQNNGNNNDLNHQTRGLQRRKSYVAEELKIGNKDPNLQK